MWHSRPPVNLVKLICVVLMCLRSDMVWMKNWQHLLLKSKVISLTMGYWGIPTGLLFNRVWRIQFGRQFIRSAPLALMDMNHARGQRSFRRLEVQSILSVIICSWCALKKRLYAFIPPLMWNNMWIEKKNSSQILYVQIQKFKITATTSDSIFEN